MVQSHQKVLLADDVLHDLVSYLALHKHFHRVNVATWDVFYLVHLGKTAFAQLIDDDEV